MAAKENVGPGSAEQRKSAASRPGHGRVGIPIPRSVEQPMRRLFSFHIRNAAIVLVVCTATPCRAFATDAGPATDAQIDPAPCFAAVAADDADKIVAMCGALIENEKTLKADRIKALVARAGAYDRGDQIDLAIGDYDTALRLDPTLAGIFNARG